MKIHLCNVRCIEQKLINRVKTLLETLQTLLRFNYLGLVVFYGNRDPVDVFLLPLLACPDSSEGFSSFLTLYEVVVFLGC